MRNRITVIALFMLSTIFCLVEARADALVRGDTLVPVTGPDGGEWYAMPKSRLARIADILDSLSAAAALYPVTDSALTACKQVVEGKNREIKSLMQNVRALDEIATAKDKIIAEKELQARDCMQAYKDLEKKYQKKQSRFRTWLAIAGSVITGLAAALFIATVK